LVEPDDASVTATALFLRRGNFVKQNFHGILLVQTGDSQTAILDRALLAQGYHLFSH